MATPKPDESRPGNRVMGGHERRQRHGSALKSDGALVTWDGAGYGGDAQLASEVASVTAGGGAGSTAEAPAARQNFLFSLPPSAAPTGRPVPVLSGGMTGKSRFENRAPAALRGILRVAQSPSSPEARLGSRGSQELRAGRRYGTRRVARSPSSPEVRLGSRGSEEPRAGRRCGTRRVAQSPFSPEA